AQRPVRRERPDVELVDDRALPRLRGVVAVRPPELLVIDPTGPAMRPIRLPAGPGVGSRFTTVQRERVLGAVCEERLRAVPPAILCPLERNAAVAQAQFDLIPCPGSPDRGTCVHAAASRSRSATGNSCRRSASATSRAPGQRAPPSASHHDP